ncbi:MAG: DNA repair protein RadC [Clostridiaceae bacterium]|nr:DNA repair protein RadC [Clostridiaceae bacterium]
MKSEHVTMHDLPEDDRPYEKLLKNGSDSLTESELLAIIIRSGSRNESALSLCQRLLQHQDPENGLEFLRESSLEELMAFPGIGQVKAVQIRAAIELGLRVSCSQKYHARMQIRKPEDALELLEPEMIHLPHEELRLILLDIRNRIIRICRICEGGLATAVIYPRDLFREAVKANAAALIMVHNHPSGESTPSNDDLATTRKMVEMGEMMGIKVVDHLILAAGGSISLKQIGLV